VRGAIAQLRLLDAPLATLQLLEPDEANDLLVAWGHKLGPVHRPFRMEAYALVLNGRPVSVAVSASTVSGHVVGWLDLAKKERPVRFERQEVVELARLASAPDAAWATRVMLRLWAGGLRSPVGLLARPGGCELQPQRAPRRRSVPLRRLDPDQRQVRQ
jgi:hypothetical protein